MNGFSPKRSPRRPATGAKSIIVTARPENESATAISGPPSSSRTKTGSNGDTIEMPTIATSIANQRTTKPRDRIPDTAFRPIIRPSRARSSRQG